MRNDGTLQHVLFLIIICMSYVRVIGMLSIKMKSQDGFRLRFTPAPFGPIWEQILQESLSGLGTGPQPSLDRITALSGQLLDAAGNDYTVALSVGRLWAQHVVWFGSTDAMADMGRWVDGCDVQPGHLLPERFVLPPGRLAFNQQNINVLLMALIPIQQALPIIPEIWSDCGLKRVSIAEHFDELIALSQIDPDTAELIFRGDLIKAETLLLNSNWIDLVWRSAVLWLIADIFRTGQLVRSIDQIAHRAVDLNKLLLQPQAPKARVASPRGPWLRVGSALGNSSAGFSSIAGLIFYPEEGRKPKFRERDEFKALRNFLEDSPTAKKIEANSGNNGVHYRYRLGKIGSSLKFHANATSRLRAQPQKGNRKGSTKVDLSSLSDTGLADKSSVEIILGVPPIPAIIASAILVDMALENLRKGAQDRHNPILEHVALTKWDSKNNYIVKSNFKIIIHLMRAHWWNYEFGKNCNTDWHNINLSAPGILSATRVDLERETLLQTEIEIARKFIRNMPPVKDDKFDAYVNFPRSRRFIDISMRYRG